MIKLFEWLKSFWFKRKLHKQFRIACKNQVLFEKHGYSIQTPYSSYWDYIEAHFDNEEDL